MSAETLHEGRPLLDTKRATTPGGFARALRARGPVFFWEPDRIWVVTGHELGCTVCASPDYSADRAAFFMARLAGIPLERVGNFLGVVSKMMVNSDPPEHTARRKLAQYGIADSVIEDFRPSVERAVAELIGKVAGKKRFELVAEIALPLPCTILADLFSIPAERRQDFYGWANDMTQFFGGAGNDIEQEAGAANVGARSLDGYFRELIAERRRAPAGGKETERDFLSHLLEHQAAMGLDDSELVSQAAMMLVAGSITTTDQICNNMYALLAEGPGLDALADPNRLDAALEEASRLDPAVNFVFRAVKRATTLGGAALEPGQLVFVSSHAASRDPAVFDAPDEFRIDRARNPHLAFGFGIHYCLGARLGRIQMSLLFRRLRERFPGLALDPSAPAVRKHQSLGFSGFESLPLKAD